MEAPAPKSADVLQAAQSLVGKVDAIYVPTDNTVVTALEAIVKVGRAEQAAGVSPATPIRCRAAPSRRWASTMATSAGRPARSSLRVLKGEKPGDIPVEGVEITELFVNPAAAEAMGVTLPEAVVRAARRS